MVELDPEIANLIANLIAGVIGPTIQKALAEREAERNILVTRLGRKVFPRKPVPLPSTKALMAMFESRVADLRRSLDGEETRTQASQVLSGLIEKVVIHPANDDARAEGELVASTARLIVFARNEKSLPLCGGLSGTDSSIKVVAGAGFEPATFRL